MVSSPKTVLSELRIGGEWKEGGKRYFIYSNWLSLQR